MERRFNAWTQQHCDDQDQRFRCIDQGFAAILNREWHMAAFEVLRQQYDIIAQPVYEGSGIHAEEEWLTRIAQWRKDLDTWISIVDYYVPEIRGQILSVPDSVYDSEFGFNESNLSANQVHRFKQVTIWWSNAQSAAPRILQSIESAAFYSPSLKGRPSSPPRPPSPQ